jgi:glucose/arabinose dehydrogenase
MSNTRDQHTTLFNRFRSLLLLCFLLMAGCQPAAPADVPIPTTAPRVKAESQPIPGGPVLLWSGLGIRNVAVVDAGSIKLALHPLTGELYILNPYNGLRRIPIRESNRAEKVANPADIVEEATLSGMAFGPDGTLYIVANRTIDENYNQAVIRRGTAGTDGTFQWQTLAQTEPYPLSKTPFDHLFNGIVVSPDGKWVYVNSGSRTDHGEEENNGAQFQDVREAPLTARILRLPADAINLTLENNEGALEGLTYARGTRNAYDLEFAPNGDLFAVDNGPDADFPDELNWLREGHHYGFPWQFGDQDNPQQFPDYTSISDKRLSPDFTAVKIGAYRRDPEFPKSPGGFTLPIINLGPDADQYRAEDGSQHDASDEDLPLYTFTPHRSPLGLVFVTSAEMPLDFQGNETGLSAFLLSWGAAGGNLTDRGQDLLHLRLTKRGDNYEAVTTQIARGFVNPIDAVLIDNKLCVLDFGTGTVWELTFK